MRVALLVPDRDQAQIVMEWLSAEGEGFSCCGDDRELLACLGQAAYQAVVLDGTESVFEGGALLKQIRQNFPSVPVLWLAAPDDEAGVVDALAQGADDYLFKPLSASELLTRLRVLCSLRNSNMPGTESVPAPLFCGPFLVDYRQRRITRRGHLLALTDKDFSLAAYMFEHLGELLSRQQLLEDVWGVSNTVNTRTVDMHVSRLRKALDLQGTGYEIKTVHQQGYRLERL